MFLEEQIEPINLPPQPLQGSYTIPPFLGRYFSIKNLTTKGLKFIGILLNPTRRVWMMCFTTLVSLLK